MMPTLKNQRTPPLPATEAVRVELAKREISRSDVKDAVGWARQRMVAPTAVDAVEAVNASKQNPGR